MTGPLPPRRDLAAAVLARLRAMPTPAGAMGLQVFRGEIDADLARVPYADPADGTSDRVGPYVVLYDAPGAPGTPAAGLEADLADRHEDRTTLLTLTVAAGYRDQALAAIDAVHAQLHRWTPPTDPAGPSVAWSPLRVPPGYQPSLDVDQQVQPPRHYAVLQYRTHVTA